MRTRISNPIILQISFKHCCGMCEHGLDQELYRTGALLGTCAYTSTGKKNMSLYA